jgi:hypothetical protein
LPHVLAVGSVADTDDVQTPTIDGEVDVPPPGVPAGAAVPVLGVDEGDKTLEPCWKPHAPTVTAAATLTRTETNLFVVMITNLSADTRFWTRPPDETRCYRAL